MAGADDPRRHDHARSPAAHEQWAAVQRERLEPGVGRHRDAAGPSRRGTLRGATRVSRPRRAPSWQYSSGTTNIISRALRAVINDDAVYAEFPHRALFDRIGMSSALIEADASGAFIGSSFGYATARDWARLGMLYVNDGVWNGQRILPEGWVAYTRSPAPADPTEALWRACLAEGRRRVQRRCGAARRRVPCHRPCRSVRDDDSFRESRRREAGTDAIP